MRFTFVLLALATCLTLTPASAQGNGANDGPVVYMVVTAETSHGYGAPDVTRDDVMVHQGKIRDQVTDWVPAKGDHAGLQLFILVDDSAGTSLGSQLDDVRQFINSQPASTSIGVAYMQNGAAQIVQDLTNDHAKAAKSLRLPMGAMGVNASPYFSLQDLIKRWPEGSPRREVLMISSGIDLFYGEGSNDPYVGAAIEDAQHAGVLVYTIYAPGAGYYGNSYWRWWWGQIYLSQVSDETGGEAYYMGFTGPAVSFAPYVDEFSHRLENQYLLGFRAQPEKKAGLQSVRIMTEVPNTQLVAADRVYVPATP